MSASTSLRILVVEDDPSAGLLYKSLFASYGAIDLATHGMEAFGFLDRALASGEHYDLVCADIQMPDIDGFTVIEEIRKKEAASGVTPCQIFVVTCSVSAANKDRAMKLGANGFFGKPVDITLFEAALKKTGVLKTTR
jgi:two-component system chemotaxis response regulator CheY